MRGPYARERSQTIKMPNSPRQLFDDVGCVTISAVPWGTKPQSARPGVYVVSLHSDATRSDGLSGAPLDVAAIAAWIVRVPSLTLDGRRPTPESLAKRLARYWLADEAVLYIGKATSLRARLGQYYSTPLGDRRPHAGGYWVKTLTKLNSLTVHYSELDAAADPGDVENRMLRLFAQAVPRRVRAAHPQPSLTIPFANLVVTGVGQRNHGIRHAVPRG